MVISPLIALMRDQVRGLREAGIEAGALTSGNTQEETDQVWEALEQHDEPSSNKQQGRLGYNYIIFVTLIVLH